MKPKFYNKNGTLTAYALACGYIEELGEWQLYRDGCFHVRKSGFYLGNGSVEWHTFSTLTEARQALKKLAKVA